MRSAILASPKSRSASRAFKSLDQFIGPLRTVPNPDWLLGFLPNHFLRILLFSVSEKSRLAESTISCPFCEFDLADESRLYPMAALHFGSGHWLAIWAATFFRKIGKRTSVARNLLELGEKGAEQIFIEAGADFAGKLEFGTLVTANQDRAKILAGSFRVGVSADHELLFLLQLQLDPGPASFCRFISGIDPLSNQTFDSKLSSALQAGFATVFDGSRIPDYIRRLLEKLFQLGLSLFHWKVQEALSVQA